MSQSFSFETVEELALSRLRGCYERAGRAYAWTDATRAEFLRAFSFVPAEMIMPIIDEIIYNPDLVRYSAAPEPRQFVEIGRRMAGQRTTDVADVIEEIMDAIDRYGIYGQTHPERPNIRCEGAPPLSQEANRVVAAMGGWRLLCLEEVPAGVLRGQLIKIAESVLQRKKQALLFNEPSKAIEGSPAPMGRLVDEFCQRALQMNDECGVMNEE